MNDMCQIIIDAIHDEQDWPGIAAGIADQDRVERRQALAVLTTDEMKSIRLALRALTAEHGFGARTRQHDVLARWLPESVIEWVLS